MKLRYLSVFIILYLFPALSFADPVDGVAALIRKGNIHELSKLFAPNVEVLMMADDNVYSKEQAEVMLDKFFSQNKPVSVSLLHKVNSSRTYQFAVLIVTTARGNFRVTYTLKGTQNNLMLIEMRIEPERVK